MRSFLLSASPAMGRPGVEFELPRGGPLTYVLYSIYAYSL
nr:MAG TPA: hypothetical protein [Caudoviricetes sp.]DAV10145.1 MAG TPA: hypothetical protein [Caudoviricetes sp.]